MSSDPLYAPRQRWMFDPCSCPALLHHGIGPAAPARRAIAALAAAVIAFWAPSAQADGAFRTVLVIDASSSMKRTDPDDLRKVAAELFVDLARQGDHIAVTGFDEAARQSTGGFVDIVGPDSRAQLKSAIRAIGNDGKWTDFAAGLGEARRLLAGNEKKPGDQDLIVFLTDGRCEPDPKGPLGAQAKAGSKGRSNARAERTELCKQKVLDEIAPTLSGARVYAIGLSKNAPAAFLEEMGRRTGGVGQVTMEPRTLPPLFAGVYARLLGSRLQEADIEGEGTFEVYEGAESLGLVIVGRTARSETLRDPGGTEIAIDNREPDKIYFTAQKEYRFYRIAAPEIGTWTVQSPAKNKVHLAILQHFDLALAFVDPPEAVELGKRVTLRARLASRSGAMPPMEFLDRHEMGVAVMGPKAKKAGGQPVEKPAERRMSMTRDDAGVFSVEFQPEALGPHGCRLTLRPKAGGVLSRNTEQLIEVRVIPPVYLAAEPVAFAAIKQGAKGEATLSLKGSKVGVPLQLALAVTDQASGQASGQASSKSPGGVTIAPDRLTLVPGQRESFPLTVTIGKDAPGGEHTLSLQVTPLAPVGFAERAISVPVTVRVVPLSFWELYGTWIIRISGGLLALVVLIGLFAPAQFKKRSLLYYADIRDPELVRRSSYPLDKKARRGFYRAARVALGSSGPTRKGGVVILRAQSGGRILAVPASASARVFRVELPGEDEDESALISDLEPDERPRVPLKKGGFMLSPRVGYEIQGSGLVFWYK